MDLEPMFVELFELEKKVAEAIRAATPKDQPRFYGWRPPQLPQLPGLWSWLDDGTVEIPDTARVDDMLVVTATLAVAPNPAAMDQSLRQLLRMTDIFRGVIDPALKTRHPLNGTARTARRILTRPNYDEFPGGKVAMCMDMHIAVGLPTIVNPS